MIKNIVIHTPTRASLLCTHPSTTLLTSLVSQYETKNFSRRVTTPISKSKAKLRGKNELNFEALEKEINSAYSKKSGRAFQEVHKDDRVAIKAEI